MLVLNAQTGIKKVMVQKGDAMNGTTKLTCEFVNAIIHQRVVLNS